MNFQSIKAASRRVVHGALSVPCTYTGPDTGAATVEITARLHDRIMVGGQGGGEQGYATIIEGVTRCIFNREDLTAAGITLQKRGRITFPDYNGQGLDMVAILDARDSYDGPVTEKWSVAPA